MLLTPTQKALSGKQIVRLMRQHKRRIAELAVCMQITQVRVREVRAKGVEGQFLVMDWLQGITGDPYFAVK